MFWHKLLKKTIIWAKNAYKSIWDINIVIIHSLANCPILLSKTFDFLFSPDQSQCRMKIYSALDWFLKFFYFLENSKTLQKLHSTLCQWFSTGGNLGFTFNMNQRTNISISTSDENHLQFDLGYIYWLYI